MLTGRILNRELVACQKINQMCRFAFIIMSVRLGIRNFLQAHQLCQGTGSQAWLKTTRKTVLWSVRAMQLKTHWSGVLVRIWVEFQLMFTLFRIVVRWTHNKNAISRNEQCETYDCPADKLVLFGFSGDFGQIFCVKWKTKVISFGLVFVE
jgi:hypothetical protein